MGWGWGQCRGEPTTYNCCGEVGGGLAVLDRSRADGPRLNVLHRRLHVQRLRSHTTKHTAVRKEWGVENVAVRSISFVNTPSPPSPGKSSAKEQTTCVRMHTRTLGHIRRRVYVWRYLNNLRGVDPRGSSDAVDAVHWSSQGALPLPRPVAHTAARVLKGHRHAARCTRAVSLDAGSVDVIRIHLCSAGPGVGGEIMRWTRWEGGREETL